MKRMNVLAALVMSAVVFCSVAKGEGTNTMTQLELAKMMVQLCGLQTSLPADRAPTDADYFRLLMFNNIQPAGGWQADQLLTRADLARVVVLGMQEGSKVQNPDNPQAWIDYLVDKGIRVDTIGLTTKPVEPLAFPMSVEPAVAVQNILNDVVKPLPPKPATPTGPAKGARI